MKNLKEEIIYIIGDGDNIRHKLEYHLLDSNLDDLKTFSHSLINAIESIKIIAIEQMKANIVYATGDEVFFYVCKTNYKRNIIEEMLQIFCRITKCQISFGIGESIEQAFINLRIAKSIEGIKIVEK